LLPKQAHRLSIEWLAPKTLSRNRRNARKHSKRGIGQLALSISTFGFIVPVLIDSEGNVLAGHGRLAAAEKLGYTQIPAIRTDHLTPAQAKAFALADNRLTEVSTWDDKLLAEALKELTELELDFSIEATGFATGEIDFRIESINTACAEAEVDAIPSLTTAPPVTKHGDQWRLGKHIVRCDNALNASAYEGLLGDEEASVVFTDPPYNVKIDGHATGLGKVRHREFVMASGEMTSGQFESFLKDVCSNLMRHSLPGSLHYICMDWRHAPELLAAGKESYAELKNICIWVKSNAGMGSLYRSQHEFVFVFKNGAGKHRNNIELGRHGRNRTNVWHYPSASDFGRGGDDGLLAGSHPTPKPVRMIADAILDCTARGDIVLDPFLGAGSTLMAAERVGRVCRGMEIDPVYVDLTIRRWQNFTGDCAVHAETGKLFGDPHDGDQLG
jgi:DNA modification methylase